MEELKTLYIDFDGVIVNTIKAIVSLYNYDFLYYKNFEIINWTDIETWNFEECNCCTREDIDKYFNQKRFFDRLEFMPFVKKVMESLAEKYDIYIVSMGDYPNLKLKNRFILEHFPYAKFIGCDFSKYSDKSHIDMSDGIIIDDSVINLERSNAGFKICFGDEYIWNREWKGFRASNWIEIENLLL